MGFRDASSRPPNILYCSLIISKVSIMLGGGSVASAGGDGGTTAGAFRLRNYKFRCSR